MNRKTLLGSQDDRMKSPVVTLDGTYYLVWPL
jgi:hypothetical protein